MQIEEKEYDQSFDWRIWKKLFPFMKPFRKYMIIALVFNKIGRASCRERVQISVVAGSLKKRMAGTTVILIAHRITTLMQADCIMVLEDGAVAEMGSHEQLMEHHGIYRRIYDIQMNTQLDADSV